MKDDATNEALTLRRCLALLQRLLRGPASKTALIAAVCEIVGEDAYAVNQDNKRYSAFEKDMRTRLPRYLGADARFNRRTGCYELIEFTGLPGFDLSDDALAALAFLEATFQPGAPHYEKVHALRNQLCACLSEERRLELARLRITPRMDLRRLDPHPIDPHVVARVEQALARRRVLCFHYRSPFYEDGEPRRHIVEPYDLTFDTQRRHQYLYAYCRRTEGPEGEQLVQRYIYYRLDRIAVDGLEVLESKLGPSRPRSKRYLLVYRLSPQIARLGEVTQHFEEMQTTLEEDGSATVQAEVSNLFFAMRTLLHYGPNCQVLGGPEALREMREIVNGMAKLYENS